ncbi:MAG: fibronectin type III domain-containing protein [Flavobacteriales bacterium]|nr:fibronectin type III domain-containing protein [Flavobacteriales bacterium]
MTHVFQVKLGLAGLTPTDLVEKGRNLVEKCTGNANLTLPANFLTDMTTALDTLQADNIAVRDNGGRQDVLTRNLQVAAVQELVRQLAGYVQAQCGDDAGKIASTGFTTHRVPSPIGVLDAPGNLRAERGRLPGEVHLRWDGVYGRLMYRGFITSGDPKDESTWQELVQTSKNFHTVTGLDSDKAYYFRVQAIGAAGEGKMSDSATAKAA